MGQDSAIGWSEDPDEPNHYRYWNGSEWSGHATVSDDGHVSSFIPKESSRSWRNIWYRKVLRNTVVFHTVAWFDCSVPGTRDHLRRFMQTKEQRMLDEVLELRGGRWVPPQRPTQPALWAPR
jgi:hypothetical protein